MRVDDDCARSDGPSQNWRFGSFDPFVPSRLADNWHEDDRLRIPHVRHVHIATDDEHADGINGRSGVEPRLA